MKHLLCHIMIMTLGASVPATTPGAGDKLFESSVVHRIYIEFCPDNFWDSLLIYKKCFDSLQVPVYLRADVSVNGEKLYSSGVRFKGESSFDFYKTKKKSLRIKFNAFIRGQEYDGLKSINLNNSFRDPTFLREKLYLDFLRTCGIPSPRCTYAEVYLNGSYWGLYLLVEEIDKTFLRRSFGNSDGEFYHGEPNALFAWLGNDAAKYLKNYELKGGPDSTCRQLIGLINIINNQEGKTEGFLKSLDSVFHTAICLRAWAVNNLLVNIDAHNMMYSHNYYLYFNTGTQRFEWVPHDGNYSLCSWSPNLKLTEAEQFNVLYLHDSVSSRPLPYQLMQHNVSSRNVYLNIISEITKNYFVPEALFSKIDSLVLRIENSVYRDTLKMYTNEDYRMNLTTLLGDPDDPGNFIPGLKPFILERRKQVLRQLRELGIKDKSY